MKIFCRDCESYLNPCGKFMGESAAYGVSLAYMAMVEFMETCKDYKKKIIKETKDETKTY